MKKLLENIWNKFDDLFCWWFYCAAYGVGRVVYSIKLGYADGKQCEEVLRDS